MKKRIIKKVRRKLCLPLPQRRYLPTSSLTPAEIQEEQIIIATQQEREIEMEFFHGKYPVVERRY